MTSGKMLWYWGKNGSGISRKVRQDHPGAYNKLCDLWWDGYKNEEVVSIESLDQTHRYMFNLIKSLGVADCPFQARFKGGQTRMIRPKLVIITSNYHPSWIFTDKSDLEQILQRFECVEIL